jgi:5-methylthioadenosine/S-adenosylhomocysteine deaminase
LARGFNERNVPDQFIETTEEIIEDMARLHETWHGQENGRLRLDFNPHDLYFVTEKTMLTAQEKALEWDIGIHLHTAETQDEIELFYNETGMRHVEWLADRKLLGPYFQLAHSVWVTSDEIDQIAQSGAVVVHNPVSNMFLNDGVSPVPEMLNEGIPIAVGTDGQACNNGQEMMDTLKWVSNLHKINSQDARVFSPEQVIKMACRDGAEAFGHSIQIGSLDPGKKADLVIIDLDNPRMTMPSLSIPSLLVNFARTEDVVTTIVDGKVLMRDREILFVDEEQLKRDFRDARTSLLERIGIF